ncbi:MAG TPA: type II secretion system F family protein [Rhizomicrobium sp.]|jgi:tight adherence protein B|nr:type II secretion system F family protein [Rhizomicrobium sp.]
MDTTTLYAVTAVLFVLATGGAVFAFSGGSSAKTQKRMAAVGRAGAAAASASAAAADNSLQKRKNVQALIKDLEKQQAAKKQKISLRRRIEQAGLAWTPRTFWLISGGLAIAAVAACDFTGQPIVVVLLAALVAGLGLPRWALNFLRNRRQKKFTGEFANAIDAIVRSVKSGLPTTEALKIVAREAPQPVSGEFHKLVEGMKVGVTLDQGLKRMFESMPTPEVNFFMIVMTIQQKSGGNLSEALGNLSGVLRDRKRLQAKIKAMSSEAKASAMIIGSLPPGVMALVWFTSPDYITILFHERLGNIMLAGCAVWMTIGIFVMKKLVNFKI